jgi:hypothetical protein
MTDLQSPKRRRHRPYPGGGSIINAGATGAKKNPIVHKVIGP